MRDLSVEYLAGPEVTKAFGNLFIKGYYKVSIGFIYIYIYTHFLVGCPLMFFFFASLTHGPNTYSALVTLDPKAPNPKALKPQTLN